MVAPETRFHSSVQVAVLRSSSRCEMHLISGTVWLKQVATSIYKDMVLGGLLHFIDSSHSTF